MSLSKALAAVFAVACVLGSACGGFIEPVPLFERSNASSQNTSSSSSTAAKTSQSGSYNVFGQTYQTLEQVQAGFSQTGVASWYGPNFHGKPTASGEVFDMNQLTAAHRNLPLPTTIRVTHLENQRSVVVRVNDRGPFVAGRMLDLSKAAAERLDMIQKGTARVRIEVLQDSQQAAAKRSKPQPLPQTQAAAQGGTSGVLIQTGVFKEQANAQRMVRTLESHGLVPATIRKSGTLHVVSLGPYPSSAEAFDLKDKISRFFGIRAFIVSL